MNMANFDELTKSEYPILNDMMVDKSHDLYMNTYIISETSEIKIEVVKNKPACIIKFDTMKIDWMKFKEYLDNDAAKITKVTKEYELQRIINKLKKITQFQKDNDYWNEYDKLDHKEIGIPKTEELKIKYK